MNLVARMLEDKPPLFDFRHAKLLDASLYIPCALPYNSRMANPPRAFVAFDYDNDSTLRDFLIGQSKHSDTNFELRDWSVKEPFAQSTWKEKVRTRIRACDLVIVICGEKTDKATGVDVELKIAQEEKKPYFLLKGYPDKICTVPPSAKTADKLYKWTWDNLKNLVGGAR